MSTAQAIDLSAWCEREESRYAIREPFVLSGWRYATDGRRIIRIPAPGEPDTVAPLGKLPRVNVVFDGWPAHFAKLPEAPPTTLTERDCPTCDGDGCASRKECSCESGSRYCCECGGTHDCHTCRGRGFIGVGKCATCRGEKRFEQPYLVEIGGVTIDARYFECVKALPGPIRFAVRKDMVMFRFDGGEAAIAKLKRETTDEPAMNR